MQLTLPQLLTAMIHKGASDLHITAGSAPLLRIDGSILSINVPPLSPEEAQALCYTFLSEAQKAQFERDFELDFAFAVPKLSRFRANLYVQRGSVGGAFRAIPFKILTCDDLGLPQPIVDMASRPRGLVLVTGPTGSGKSTTLASLIDKINSETRQHIVTVEDPIEYVHMHKSCVINQREIGADTTSFKEALKHVLRQDPDVVLVGEMRDLETIEAALTIAETGHLVFATLHTNSCAQTINRVVDVFPPHQQSQIRAQLSFVLQGVVTQLLLPRTGAPGRVLAMEIMIPNAAIRNLIRENKIAQLYSAMQVAQEKSGMQTMNQSLFALAVRRTISVEDAIGRSSDPDELRTMFDGRTANAKA